MLKPWRLSICTGAHKGVPGALQAPYVTMLFRRAWTEDCNAMRLGVYEAGDGRQGLQEQWPSIGLTRLKISTGSRLVATAKRQATRRVTVVTLFISNDISLR